MFINWLFIAGTNMGKYENYIYCNQLRRLETRIKDDVIYNLGLHRPRIYFDLKN